MTAQEYEDKYLNKVVRYETPLGNYGTKMIVHGKIDSITMEDAIGEPEIIFMINRKRYAIDVEYFADYVTLL